MIIDIYGIERVQEGKTITGKKIYQIEVYIYQKKDINYTTLRSYFNIKQKKNIKDLEEKLRKCWCESDKGLKVPCIREGEELGDLVEIEKTEIYGGTYWKIVFTLEIK